MITFKIILVLILSSLLILFNYNRTRTKKLYRIILSLTPRLRKYFFKLGKFIVSLKERIKKSDNARKFFIRMVIVILFVLQIAAFFAGQTADENMKNFVELLINKQMTLEEIEYEYKTFHVNKLSLFCSEIFMFSLLNYNFADKIFLTLTNKKIQMICFALMGFFLIFYSPQESIAYETAIVILFTSDFYSDKVRNLPPIGIKPVPLAYKKTNNLAA